MSVNSFGWFVILHKCIVYLEPYMSASVGLFGCLCVHSFAPQRDAIAHVWVPADPGMV